MQRRSFLALPLVAGYLRSQSDWNDPFPPHRIADGLYYVGSKELSSYLITTNQGHILINSSFERTVPIIRANVEKLGFRFPDIKILLCSHAHGDHVEGHALVKRQTGAEVYVMRGDEDVIAGGGAGQYKYKDRWKPVKVDRVLKNGDKVTLGSAALTAHLTPGHTRGCTTWAMQANDRGKLHSAVIVGSPNVNPGYQLVNNAEYPEIASDFARCFRVLKSLNGEIFLGAHGSYYDMQAKAARLNSGVNPFIDPEGYRAFVRDREQRYESALKQQTAAAGQ